MTHAWCHDIARDDAVRAAEDNRRGPLPTLGEAIARPFANAAERSVPVSETGEGQSGMRTERVTLEITHPSPNTLCKWAWGLIVGCYCESVRVVDETHFDELAQVAMERDAAIRERDELRTENERLNEDRIDALLHLPACCGSLADAASTLKQDRDALAARVAELEARDEKWQAENAEAFWRLQKQFDDEWQGAQAASGGGVQSNQPLADGGRPREEPAESATADSSPSLSRDTPVVPADRADPTASVGGEPVAWGVVARQTKEVPPGCASPHRVSKEPFARFATVTEAQQFASKTKGNVVPIYAPPQPRGWLTKNEIAALTGCCVSSGNLSDEGKKTIRNLLARSSPPEVVLPLADLGDRLLRDGVIDALAAAGVAVKEVGSD